MRKWALVLLLACAAHAKDKELKHDNGEQAGKRSSAGTGHVVSFTAPKGKWWIKSVRVFGARYGGGYDPAQTMLTVSVCDRRLGELSAKESPYTPFTPGRFAWVELPVTPVLVPKDFTVCVEFNPTRTKGVYVAHAETKKSHSAYGVPGGNARPYEHEWMIRVRLSNRQPKGAQGSKTAKGRGANYLKDFEYLARTVRNRYPALKKKSIDWAAVCKQWRPRFVDCKDDKAHLLNVHRLLAVLQDSHTGITKSKVEVHVPSFDGLFGAGLWIAAEGKRLLVRASLHGHILPGSELLEIGGKPAHKVHESVRSRLREWSGWSSTHFLDARLSFQFFPFGDAQSLMVKVLEPDGDQKQLKLPRWGPGGIGISRLRVTLPNGVAFAKGAAFARDDDLGYIRITGWMNLETQRAFDAAFDKLRGVKGILLDCRGMGGGGDNPAWAMAGRFGVRTLKKTGDWQFDGPVVMLQDEREVSSAETFTWAMGESGRALTVGRPTGGATIIPSTFKAPSRLFEFRMGTHDRRTTFRKVRPEGIGSPPDIYVPYEPYLLKKYDDPTYHVGLAALKRLVAGDEREAIITDLSESYGCDKKPLLEAMLAWERKLAEHGRGDPDKRKRIEQLLAALK